MKTKKKVYLYFILFIVLVFVIAIFYNVCHLRKKYDGKYVTKCFTDIDLSDVDNLMIVAHPDDETIWGGCHLLEEKYLVVCVTAGRNEKRVKELKTAMNKTGDKCIMLGYPDKTLGKRDDWSKCKKDIEKDIDTIIGLKKWDKIVTHNAEGEYGHQHHKMTHEIVTKVYKQKYIDEDNLYYFGKYYSRKDIENFTDVLKPCDSKLVEKKEKILKDSYKSQSFIFDKFGQMFPYEEWTKF